MTSESSLVREEKIIPLRSLAGDARAFLSLPFLVILFIFCAWFAKFHTAGDQVHYRDAYEALVGLDIFTGLSTYRSIIFSGEPVHFFVIWCASNLGLNRDLFWAFIDTAIAFLAIRWLGLKGFGIWISLLVVGTNYYLYTFFFTLEKLKVAFFFLLLFLNSRKRGLARGFSLLMTGLSHFQMAIPIGAAFLGHLMKRGDLRRKQRLLPIIIVLAGAGYLVFGSFINSKLTYYLMYNARVGNGLESIQILFALLAIWIAGDRQSSLWFMISMLAAIFFLGGDRLNMFLYFGMLYFLDRRNSSAVPILIGMAGFFSIKTIGYLYMVYSYGG